MKLRCIQECGMVPFGHFHCESHVVGGRVSADAHQVCMLEDVHVGLEEKGGDGVFLVHLALPSLQVL